MEYDIVILGSGESGTGAALLASRKGLSVFVSDAGPIPVRYREELELNGIPYEENLHTDSIILAAKEIIKSPGIPESSEMMTKVRLADKVVISEIEFAYRYKGESRIVAITGSNGKTTTTTLTYHIFKNANYDVAMVGNIGYSFARQVATEPRQWYIMEISSFQLDDIQTFCPDIAMILNITPDHLDRYGYQMENYVASKFRISMAQTENNYLILNKDDQEISTYLLTHITNPKIHFFSMKEIVQNAGAYVSENEMVIRVNGEPVSIGINDISLNGKHNTYNSMAACIASRLAEIRTEKIRESLRSFQSLEHRMEHVVNIRDVEFINDSKATNLNSVWYALESMTKPIVLIMGGVDKGNDYNEIMELIREKVKAIVCLGKDNTAIQEAFKGVVPIIDSDNMRDAVAHAYELAQRGDCVLLSPACASFDLFKNYEDRGNQFKEAVKEL